jgi:hypothetical protein
MGRIVARGWIGAADVSDALWSACDANGLVADDGVDAVQKTLASGLDAGGRDPAPDTEDRPILSAANDNIVDAVAPIIPVTWDGEATFEVPKWLVKDLVPEASVGLFVGESGAGKSFAAVDLAVSVAIGRPFFKRKTKHGGVLYIAAEAGGTIAERIEAARLGYVCPTLAEANDHGIDPSRLPIALVNGVPNLASESGAERVIATARAVAKEMMTRYGVPLRLIIIDTLVAAFALSGWNDPSDAALAMKVLSDITEATGATTIGVHHHGKDVTRGAAGSFVFTAEPDFIVSMFRDVDVSGAVTRRWIAQTKTRRGATGWTCDFNLKNQVIGTDEDGVEVPCAYIVADTENRMPNPKKKKQARGESRAVRAFKTAVVEALDAFGTIEDVHGTGPAVKAVAVCHVRSEFERRYVADSDEPAKKGDAIRKAFKRGLDDARSAEWVQEGRWHDTDWLWRVPELDIE